MSEGGLTIGGEKIELSDRQVLSVLKYVVVPESDWTSPVFKSGTVDQIMELADPRAVEIVGAMIDDYLSHDFASPPELVQNIKLRKGVVDAMREITSGAVDADYAEPVVGVPPTIGYLPNLEVLWSPDAAKGKGVLPGDLPFEAPDASWQKIPTRSPWTGNAFFQKPGVKLSDALADITPFRGECAGALQLSMLMGCLRGLGAEALDAVGEAFGPAYLGLGTLPDADTGAQVPTTATRFLTQSHDLPKDYARGAAIAVPGDFMYFSNKDDYMHLAPKGGWRGENCVYMGRDALGDPHYSGLGLTWKSEFALRMFLANAYFTDCNAQYLLDRRAGETPSDPPVIIEDQWAQVRFTGRASVRYPKLDGTPAPKIVPPQMAAGLSSAEVDLRLSQLGQRSADGTVYTVRDMVFGDLLTIFEVAQSALYGPSKASLHAPDLAACLGDWELRFAPRAEGLAHLTLEDRVDMTAVRVSAPE